MTKLKTSARKPSTAIALRDALPFFKARGQSKTPWWNVTPSGNYPADLETGKAYAKAFLPLMQFNCGAAALGWIVSDMAKADSYAAAKPYKGRGAGKDNRAIDPIATGFLLTIGESLQAAVASIAVAVTAIKNPQTDLGAKFVALVEAGKVLNPLNHSTLAHDPNAEVLRCSHGK